MNKHFLSSYALLLLIVLSLSSCEAIGAIFKAGVWSGIFIVVLIVAVIIYIISRSGKQK